MAEVRKKYEDTPQWMKAPNGKPSNLSEQEWLQVRTPQFKQWFGDWESDPEHASKVVDDDGRPKVVYHGTPNGGFDVFRDESYFTPDEEYAERYERPSASTGKGWSEARNPMTYAVYLDIRNPFDTRNPEARKIFETEVFRKWGGNGAPLSELGLPDWTDGSDLLEFVKEEHPEYDGIILDEGGDTDGEGNSSSRGLSYVPVSANQIKSATENNGDFDADNPSILFQTSAPKLPAFDASTKQDIETAYSDIEEIGGTVGDFKAYLLEDHPEFEAFGDDFFKKLYDMKDRMDEGTPDANVTSDEDEIIPFDAPPEEPEQDKPAQAPSTAAFSGEDHPSLFHGWFRFDDLDEAQTEERKNTWFMRHVIRDSNALKRFMEMLYDFRDQHQSTVPTYFDQKADVYASEHDGQRSPCAPPTRSRIWEESHAFMSFGENFRSFKYQTRDISRISMMLDGDRQDAA